MSVSRIGIRSALACSAFLFFTSVNAFAQEGGSAVSTAELVERSQEAVVLIRTEGEGGPTQASGFVVDREGIIVTNHHVVERAQGIQIELPSGEVFERAQVLDVDPRRDLAVLRVPGFGLPHLELGNSDSLRVGGQTVVIGSPLGLENTVSEGIVSGRRTGEGYELLQITAPISPGSSGGPVFGPDGRVVGVAAAQIEQGQNLNFAVPVNYVRGMLNFLPEEPTTRITGSVGTDSAAAGPHLSGAENGALRIDTSLFQPYTIDIQEELDNNVTRHTTVRYRLIGESGDSAALIERFAEQRVVHDGDVISEGTIRTEATAANLRPRAAHWSVRAWRDEAGWQRLTVDLRSSDGQMRGQIQNAIEGHQQQVDRVIPPGTIIEGFVPTAIALAAGDSLTGTTWTLNTYRPSEDELGEVHVTFERFVTIDVDGEDVRAYRTVFASGASRDIVYYRARRPRILLRYGVESNREVTDIEGIDVGGGSGG